MTERGILIALEKRRRAKLWTHDEMAYNLDTFSTGEQYKRRIWEDSAEAVFVAQGCKLLGEPFPEATLIARGEICGKIKGMIVDSHLTIRQIILRALPDLKQSAVKKYLDRAYQFLHSNSSNAFWICIFYAGLKKPCLSYLEVMNNREKQELAADMEKDSRQLELIRREVA